MRISKQSQTIPLHLLAISQGEQNNTMKKQTAVEWLVDYIKNLEKYPYQTIQELEEQAKTMEKEQIKDAHIEGQRVFDNYQHTQWTTDQAEQYYNETYGGDK
jgi:hypothetical protein